MRIKVCGITNYQDAVRALDAGADALGFNFYPESPRCITSQAARDITRRLPPLVTTVGVFVNVAAPAEVESCARSAGIQVLQLHGNETADYCSHLGMWPLIKAMRVDENTVQEKLLDYPVQAYLLDTMQDGCFGGTGKTCDWEVARRFAEDLPVLLAGGLDPGNVVQAIRTVHPYGVDVCSGVEAYPGKKDPAKLTAFMKEVFDATR